MQHIVEYCALEASIAVCNVLPVSFVYACARCLGLFVYYIFPIRKYTALYNLHRAFPNKTPREIQIIIKNMYIHFSTFLFEAIIMHRIRTTLSNTVTVHGIEHVKTAHAHGKGVILWTAHIGNWQVMGQRLVNAGFPVNNIVKRQRNPFVFDREVEAMRAVGMKVTILQKTPKNIFKALKENDVVEFLSDQDAGYDGVFVDFFGIKASTPTGPALFSLKLGAPIVTAIDVRIHHMHHELFCESIDYTPTGNETHDVYMLTQIMTKKLEEYITRYPDQYFWLHKRWLTRPIKTNA